jgi:hypothetical protein
LSPSSPFNGLNIRKEDTRQLRVETPSSPESVPGGPAGSRDYIRGLPGPFPFSITLGCYHRQSGRRRSIAVAIATKKVRNHRPEEYCRKNPDDDPKALSTTEDWTAARSRLQELSGRVRAGHPRKLIHEKA